MKIYHLLLALPLLVLTACNDFLDITPTGKVIAKTGEEYRALLTNEYNYFPSDRSLTALRTDELSLSPAYTSDYDYASYFDLWAWRDDALSSTTSYFGWRRYYHATYIANYLIGHCQEISAATPAEVNQLVGEAYMMRAYSTFVLANLYAEPYTHCTPATTRGVPLMRRADVNAVPKSSSLEKTYAAILADIDSAANHLNVKTWDEGFNYRFNTLSARCLRARVLLYMGRWAEAESEAKAVADEHPFMEDLNKGDALLPVSYKSGENIVALEGVVPPAQATIGRPSADLLALYKSGDKRKTVFFKRVTASNSTLLKGGNADYMCTFRTAEFVLTAAECAARQGASQRAIDYLKPLAEKRYTADAATSWLTSLATMTQDGLISEILAERERELSFEGHRWFDLRRTTMPALSHSYGGENYTLSQGDSRYTLHFPAEAVEANPDIVNFQ